MILAVVLALGAALSNAVNLMTQHLASVASPPGVAGVRRGRDAHQLPGGLVRRRADRKSVV